MSGYTTIVIFGASGDLTRRKLIPALYHLHRKERLPEACQIVGMARTEMDDEGFRDRMQAGVQEFAAEEYDAACWRDFAAMLAYLPGDLANLDDMRALDERISAAEAGGGPANRIYHLAIAPDMVEVTVTNLGAAGMAAEDRGYRRVVVEKPFGHDLESARQLNRAVHTVLDEGQIYRIDHYLGKETVQNLLVFRFANTLFEPVWNRHYIDHVQISACETVDVGHRGGYYDRAGVGRDMLQNHLLELLSLVAMEPPVSFEAEALRNEKVKLLQSVRPIAAEQVARHTIRGQYEGYRQAQDVAPDSETETFVAARLFVDNWRWHGVPFYLRSGKALEEKSTEISILFRRPPKLMFPANMGQRLAPNDLSICIQPDEGIHFGFQAKVPDTAAEMRTVDMSFHYADSFGEMAIPDAYERLLLDVIRGDPTLFTRADSIELAWALVDPIIATWHADGAPPLHPYPPGSWGPAAATDFIAHDGYTWSLACAEHEEPPGGG